MQLVVDPQTRNNTVFDVLFILSALMNYKKYERTNLYITRASTFAQRQPLEALVETISEVLSECNRFGLVLYYKR